MLGMLIFPNLGEWVPLWFMASLIHLRHMAQYKFDLID